MPENPNTHAMPSGTLEGCLVATLFSLDKTFLFRLAKVQANREIQGLRSSKCNSCLPTIGRQLLKILLYFIVLLTGSAPFVGGFFIFLYLNYML